MAFDTLNTAAHQWMECTLDGSANGVDDGAVAFDTLNAAAHQWMECTLDESANGVGDGAVWRGSCAVVRFVIIVKLCTHVGSDRMCPAVSMDTDADLI